MNRYDAAHAARLCDGYYLPRPEETAASNGMVSQAAFERAKVEAIKNVEATVANLQGLTFDQFRLQRASGLGSSRHGEIPPAPSDKLASALAGIDEACQAGLNSSDPKHWEAALQDILKDARAAVAGHASARRAEAARSAGGDHEVSEEATKGFFEKLRELGDYDGSDPSVGIMSDSWHVSSRDLDAALTAAFVAEARRAVDKTVVHVLLGECPEVGQLPVAYVFDTQAERNVFLLGLEKGTGNGGYTICEGPNVTRMADGEIRSVPAGVNPEGPVVIYQMRTADDCSKSVVYGTDDAGHVVEVDAGSWSPDEPERETIAVDIEVHHDPDDREDAELTGEQHRDLEDNGLLTDFLTSLAKRDPDAADEILREVGAEGLRL